LVAVCDGRANVLADSSDKKVRCGTIQRLVGAAFGVAVGDEVPGGGIQIIAEGGLQVGVVVGTDEKLMQAGATWRLKVKTRR
jgi:hypothetical protein